MIDVSRGFCFLEGKGERGKSGARGSVLGRVGNRFELRDCFYNVSRSAAES